MDLMLYKERQMVGHRSSPKTLENKRRKDVYNNKNTAAVCCDQESSHSSSWRKFVDNNAEQGALQSAPKTKTKCFKDRKYATF